MLLAKTDLLLKYIENFRRVYNGLQLTRRLELALSYATAYNLFILKTLPTFSTFKSYHFKPTLQNQNPRA